MHSVPTKIDDGQGNAVALTHYLKPITKLLAGDNVEEININKPGELFITFNNRPKAQKFDEQYGFNWLRGLAKLIANFVDQQIKADRPFLTGTLPTGERVQIVMSPAVEKGYFGFSIRKPSKLLFSLDDFAEQGAFENVCIGESGISEVQKELLSLYKAKDIKNFLKLAVTSKQNIILSGGTSSGKTTFIKGLSLEIPIEERIITIEDNREMVVKQKDYLPLLFPKDGEGVSNHTAEDCVKACLRLNPDRILMSELTGGEAASYLRAIKSGHPGSLTTLHAESPSEAFENIVLMIQNNSKFPVPREQIVTSLKQTVNVVIQYKKIGFKRGVTDLYFDLYEKDRGRS